MQPNDLVKAIIHEQEQIIGVLLARKIAESSGAVQFKSENIDSVELKKEPKEIIEGLIRVYSGVFGKASEQVCIDVIEKYYTAESINLIPESVKSRIHLK